MIPRWSASSLLSCFVLVCLVLLLNCFVGGKNQQQEELQLIEQHDEETTTTMTMHTASRDDSSGASSRSYPSKDYLFPKTVRAVSIRRDVHTHDPVQRGLLHLLPSSRLQDLFRAAKTKLATTSSTNTTAATKQRDKKISLTEFRKKLQCAPHEPDVDERSIWQLMKLIPPTRQGTEGVCAWIEAGMRNFCSRWDGCQKLAATYKNGGYDKKRVMNGILLVRVVDGDLMVDFPWGSERLAPNLQFENFVLLILVLEQLSDVPDSAFLLGGQQTFLPWNVPFPAFSNSPSYKSPEMVFPWFEMVKAEFQFYRKTQLGGVSPLRSMPRTATSWDDKESRLASYGSYLPQRHVLFDYAAQRPDLFNVSFLFVEKVHTMRAWDPASTEGAYTGGGAGTGERDDAAAGGAAGGSGGSGSATGGSGGSGGSGAAAPAADEDHPPPTAGSVAHILPLARQKAEVYDPAQFKYLLVMTGGFNRDDMQATSGKIVAFLANSGSVVFLQKSDFLYHFSGECWSRGILLCGVVLCCALH